jgi:hypothetical protein
MCYNYEIDDIQLGIRNETNKQYNLRTMCYNYEIDDKSLGLGFPDLAGTIYDPTEWDNNPF